MEFWWISVADPGFSPGGVPTPKIAIIFHIIAKTCMKMKEFGPRGARVPGAPPLDSPMDLSLKCSISWIWFYRVHEN